MPKHDPDDIEGRIDAAGQQGDVLEEQEKKTLRYRPAKCIFAWLITLVGVGIATVSGVNSSKNDESALQWVRVFTIANVLVSIWANLCARALRCYSSRLETTAKRLFVTVVASIWMALTIMFVIFAAQELQKPKSERNDRYIWPAQVFSAILSVGGNVVQDEMQALLSAIPNGLFYVILLMFKNRSTTTATVTVTTAK